MKITPRWSVLPVVLFALWHLHLSVPGAGLPPGGFLNAITFGGGTFVAVGSNGVVCTSMDGSAWEYPDSGTTNTLWAVGYGNGLYVVAGERGTLLRSADAVHWMAVSIPPLSSPPRLAFGNGTFVLAGEGGPGGGWTFLTSPYAIEWKAVAVDAVGVPGTAETLPFGGIAFGDGRFLAAGGVHGANLFLTSPDGLLWTETGSVDAVGGKNGKVGGPILFGYGEFLIRATRYVRDEYGNRTDVTHTLLASSDNLHWSYRHTFDSSFKLLAARPCGLLAGVPADNPTAVVFSSTGTAWTHVPLPASTIISAAAFGNSKCVAVGNVILDLALPPAPEEPFQASPEVVSMKATSDHNSVRIFQATPPCLLNPVTFQWMFQGKPVPSATDSLLSLPGLTTNMSGLYALIARGADGMSVTSGVGRLDVLPIDPPVASAPVVTSPTVPQKLEVGVGNNLSLPVAGDGWPSPSVQWSFNDVVIPGATGWILPLVDFGATMAGTYVATLQNSLGTTSSPPFVLTPVTSAPVLGVTNAYLSVLEGQGFYFPLPRVDGAPPPDLILTREGVPTGLPLPYSSGFSMQDVTLADAGRYAVVAVNSLGRSTGAVVQLIVRPATVSPEPIREWTQRTPVPNSSALIHLAYGDGRFVAVGARGSVVISDDGLHWWEHRLKVPVDLSGITYARGVFVAGGAGNLLTSPDGIEWTTRLTGALGPVNVSVCFGNGRFVAVGQQSVILTSVDGLTWSRIHTGTLGAAGFLAVAYGNGVFIAVGLDGVPWISSSGTEWSPVDGGSLGELQGLAFGNGRFVAVGSGGAIFTSSDGVSWKSRKSGVTGMLLDVTFGNGRFVAVGKRGRILRSSDGVDWKTEVSGTPDVLQAVAFGNGLFVAAGENGTVLSSADGATWVLRRRGAPGDLDGVAAGNGVLVAVGKEGTVLTSIDGHDYVIQTAGVTNDLHGVAAADGLFVAVGEPETILTSPDAIQWTLRREGTNSSLKSVTRGAGEWVAVGTDGVILSSEDGVTWTRRFSSTLNDLNGVSFGDGLFVVVGDNLPPNGTVITSRDGKVWTRHNQYFGMNLRSVSFVGHEFIATANDGAFLVSSNGSDWQLRSSGQLNNLRAVTRGANTWVAVGNNGIILSSANATKWEDRSSAAIENLHGVVFFRGHFVTVGNEGTVLQSGPILSPAGLSGEIVGGMLHLRITGYSGFDYLLESTGDITNIAWNPVLSFTLTHSVTNIVQPIPPGVPTQFYRATVQ